MQVELVFLLALIVIVNCSVDVETSTEIIKDVVTDPTILLKLDFFHGCIASLMVILASEIGDKTFLIAAIMAVKHPRLIVFAGAMLALAFMTILSVFFGWMATVIPRDYTLYISVALFTIFGIKMIREGWRMSPNDAQEEYDEVQSDLRKREEDIERETTAGDTERGDSIRRRNKCKKITKIIIQACTMTFFAEWGDRSQVATIVLAAREDVYGVTLGGIVGHAFCTGLAVIAGRLVAQKISVRTIMILGGIIFLIFAVTALIFDQDNSEIE